MKEQTIQVKTLIFYLYLRFESVLIVLRVETKKLEKEARYMNNPIFLCAAHVIHKLKDSVSSIEKTVFISFTFKI